MRVESGTPPKDERPPSGSSTGGKSSPAPRNGSTTPALPLRHPFWLGLALVVAALNLRPALSSLGPVLLEVMRSTGIDATVASIVTTAPVMVLGLSGLMAPRLARLLGTEGAIAGMLLMLAAGIALRGVLSFPGLLTGATVAGAAIGIIGVLLPSVVKQHFPDRMSLMTGVYTMALCLGAAGAAGMTVPLGQALGAGWRAGLAFWAMPALLAAAVWLALLPKRTAQGALPVHEVRGLWRDPLAWQVTLYMGFQSALAYIVFAWLAPILRDRGLDAVAAGAVVSVSVMAQLVTALTAPMLATRYRSQSVMVAAIMAMTLTGLLGCLYAPLGAIWLWAIVLGLGQGGCISVALLLIVLRAPDAHVAAHLSSMSQSVGYVLASLGPLAVGLLHDRTGDWSTVAGLSIAIAMAATLFGIGAGRARHVRAISRQGQP